MALVRTTAWSAGNDPAAEPGKATLSAGIKAKGGCEISHQHAALADEFVHFRYERRYYVRFRELLAHTSPTSAPLSGPGT